MLLTHCARRLVSHLTFSLLPLQDDAHIFCLPNQIGPEIGRVLDLTEDIMTAFGFEADGFEVGAGIVTLNSVCSNCQ